ncbi:HyaD/HybD family hydrogenase maturation endopeptidase [Campylobacter sp. 9BO]|uniref:HyaD/HybD family hydrogenase maturation endopeptidase n=1 Tax=Campylobacter sp. 9BO TaxID=3424759 RepID=UPI003D326B15
MKVLILGIGNIMYSDEGVGVHFVKMIEKNFSFLSSEHELEFVDGGTLAMALTPIISSYDSVVIVDCLSCDDGKAGDVFFFDFKKIPLSVRWDGSAHEIEMLQTLELMNMAGDLPEVKILGVVPNRIEPMSFKLSDDIAKASLVMQKSLLKHLETLGFSCKKKANLSILDIAQRCAKKGL